MRSVKEATRSETRLVAATRTIKVLVGVGKDAAKAKAKERAGKDPEASLRAPGMATQQRLKLLFIISSPSRDGARIISRAYAQKGDFCALPHLDEDAVNRIKAAERRQREAALDSEDVPERGRSPSRDKRKGTGRKISDVSE